jgi:hypothetical protein
MSEPYRCTTIQEVKALPFVHPHLLDEDDDLYFKWVEDFNAHIIVSDPYPDEETVILALARFIEIHTIH